jgi:hypothetical protein
MLSHKRSVELVGPQRLAALVFPITRLKSTLSLSPPFPHSLGLP